LLHFRPIVSTGSKRDVAELVLARASLTVIVRAGSDIGGNVPFRSILPKRLQNKRAIKNREPRPGNILPRVAGGAHDLAGFSCGKPALDHLTHGASAIQPGKGLKAVLAAHEANRVIDYYGLAPTANLPSRLPRSIRTGQPRDLSHARCSGSLRRNRTGLAEELARARSNKRRVTAAELVAGRALLLNSADVSAREATVQERKRVDA